MNKAARKEAAEKFLAGLLELADEVVDVGDEGEPVTNREKVQRALWQAAAGHDETTRDDQGNRRVVHHRPASWAIQMLHDLILGKPAPMTEPMRETMTAKDKVSKLAVDRANEMARKAVAGTSKPADPERDRDEEESDEHDDED